ncbi:serine hydrolase [uncultured Erythrobacter sp.]|uniref:serine hydrolase n=1 Tax=uncultured Erythrobacter sp. TaxID=263913 RepID=UPI0026092BA0|nr:serine hydrolase [uncultured Erythrobacter sp.]
MSKLCQRILATVLLSIANSNPTAAQSLEHEVAPAEEQSGLQMRAEQVVALVNGELEPEEVLSESFLAAIPAERFKGIARQLTTQFGAAVAVESLDPSTGHRAVLAIRMERAIAKGAIAIDPSIDQRVSELLFHTFDPVDDSLAKIEADLAALPGKVTWRFGSIDDRLNAITSSGADEQMPIGSTFKLYVLATLACEVATGKRSWSDQVALGPNRSFPSGMLQDWPKDAPLTLHTLASLMISISDNTATDTLIDELGREAIMETLIASGHARPELNDPFLKTREMFLLKAGPPGRLTTYQRNGPDVRHQILDGIENVAVPPREVAAAFSGAPVALDVEWFASVQDLVNLLDYMRRTADPQAFEIMAINPSMPEERRADFHFVGYKGGSEPGVLNLTWMLEDKNGQDYALILSQRDDDVRFDPSALELIAQRLLSLEH